MCGGKGEVARPETAVLCWNSSLALRISKHTKLVAERNSPHAVVGLFGAGVARCSQPSALGSGSGCGSVATALALSVLEFS